MTAETPQTLPALAKAPWLTRPGLQAFLDKLTQAGHETRIVGGAVRNALLGLPVTDVDLATTAEPEEVMRLARAAGFHPVPTGLSHGTVTVIIDHTPYEVTTLRRDVETFGRHARVAFTRDWEADARRRDFTMNALYVAPDGTLFDPLGGYEDLMAGRVRFVGDPAKRIAEDALRILRFFRFSAQYGQGKLDPAGLAACAQARDKLAILSAERIQTELLKLLAAKAAVPVISAMYDHGFLVALLGTVPHLARFSRLARLEDALPSLSPDPLRRLGALALWVPEDGERLGRRFRLSRRQSRRLRQMIDPTQRIFQDLSEKSLREALYRLGQESYEDQLLLAWAQAAASSEDPAWRQALSLPERWTPPPFPFTGTRLMAHGLPKGPHIGQALRALEDWWIAAGFPTDPRKLQEAEEKIFKTFSDSGQTPTSKSQRSS